MFAFLFGGTKTYVFEHKRKGEVEYVQARSTNQAVKTLAQLKQEEKRFKRKGINSISRTVYREYSIITVK
jgi:23S rRNA maturation mini-RNase III